MNIVEIINKKRKALELTEEEIKYVVEGYTTNLIKDYQMSSLLMAIVIQGMTEQEISYLTKYMILSGESLDLKMIEGVVVDKHSTGGVGDKVSLVALPLAATCGVKIAKMSGRGLGHTGGTIDKLEAIPGFKVNLSNEEFITEVNEIGMALVGQTKNLVPADKKIYALRDVTGTVESLALIASSVMSKKIASGAKAIVLDVKVGNGAFMKTIEEARSLALMMVKLGRSFGVKTLALLTNMDEPLGSKIGNALEIEEVMETLQNKGPNDLTQMSLTIAANMVKLAKNISYEEAMKEVKEALNSKKVFEKFKEFVSVQGGNLSKLKIANKKKNISSTKEGYIYAVKALEVGNLALKLGAGRHTKDDEIDYSVGIELHKKIGDKVSVGDTLLTLYLKENDNDDYEKEVLNIFDIKEEPKEKEDLVYGIVE